MVFKKKDFGFSLIETAITVGIVALTFVISVPSMMTYRVGNLLKETADEIQNQLRVAQMRSTKYEFENIYGVHFQVDRFVLFVGPTYSASDVNNVETVIGGSLEIYELNFNGGGSDVVFDALTGSTNNFGSLKIRIKGSESFYKIDISSEGLVVTEYFSSSSLPNAPPSSFSLLSPADTSTSVTSIPTFDWQDSVDAGDTLNYTLYIDNNSDFLSPELTQLVGTASQYTLTAGQALANATYYWKVKVVDTQTFEVFSNETFSIVINNTAPGAFDLLTPTDTATVTILTPTLDWQDSTDTGDTFTYTLEVDDDNGFGSINVLKTLLSSSQYIVLGGELMDSTTYYWRVKAVDSGSNVTQSTSTFSFTTSVVVNNPPATFSLLTPTDTSNVTTLTPTLDWQDSSDSDTFTYTLEVDDNAGFTSIDLLKTGLSSATSQYTVLGGELNDNTTYYWRVKAIDTLPNTTTSNETFSFTINTPPTAFDLVTPADASTVTTTTPLLDWQDSTDTGDTFTYTLEVDDDNGFGSIDLLKTGLSSASSQYTVLGGELNNNTTYYWRVKAIDSISSVTQSTSTRSFSINTPPTAFSLLTPTDTATITTLTPTLDWQDSTDTGDTFTYTLEVDDDNGFGSIDLLKTGLSSSQYVVLGGELNDSTTYYWRVKAIDSATNTTQSTETFSFTTNVANPPPAAFSLLTPNTGTVIHDLVPALDWQDSSDTDSFTYTLEIDDNSDFSSLVVNKTGLTVSNYTVLLADGLLANTRYYWRVKAIDTAPNVTLSNETDWFFDTDEAIGWWDNNYAYRVGLTVTNNESGNSVVSAYSVRHTFNHSSLVTAKSLASGDDVRVSYYNGASWVELDRVAETAWNTTTVDIWFPLQASISASGTDTNYYIYYGNPSAGSPPADRDNIYVFFDDFNRGDSTNPGSKWNEASGDIGIASNALYTELQGGAGTGAVGVANGTSGSLATYGILVETKFNTVSSGNFQNAFIVADWSSTANMFKSGARSSSSQWRNEQGFSTTLNTGNTEAILNDQWHEMKIHIPNTTDQTDFSARLVELLTITDDTQGEFDTGTYSDTQFDAGNVWVELDGTGLTNGTGTYTSSIKDLGSSTEFKSIDWVPQAPYGKELIDSAAQETAYNTGNMNMTNNVLLMHMNESSGTVSDTSGNSNNGTESGGATYATTGKLNTAIRFDGVDDKLTVSDATSLDISDDVTIGGWFNVLGDGGSAGGNNPGDITQSVVDTLEFDTAQGSTPRMVPVSGDIYAIVYEGSGSDGFVVTVDINSTGTIANAVIDSLEFDTSSGAEPTIVPVSGDIYAIAYSGLGSDGFVITVDINSAGTIANSVIDSLEFDNQNGNTPYIIPISGDIYAIAYHGFQNDGFLKTVDINSAGTIANSVVDTLEFDTANGLNPEIIPISGTVYAIVYEGTGSDGFIYTVDIQTNGTIGSSSLDTLEFDTAQGVNPTLRLVSGDIYAVAYQGPDGDGFVKTVDIDTAGTITNTVVDTFEFDATSATDPSLISVGNDIFAIAYTDVDSDGKVITVEIATNGTITQSVKGTFEYDAADGATPFISAISGDFYSIVYSGVGADGFVSTVEIFSTASGGGSRGVHKSGAYGIDATTTTASAFINSQTVSTAISSGWNHLMFTYDKDAGSNQQKLYVNGVQANTGTLTASIATNANDLLVGDLYNGDIDELVLFSKVLTPTEILDMYKRGALRLKIQVRSCDDAACSGENFIGPDGTTGDFYQELDNTLISLPSFNLTNVSNNQYFQYQFTFETDNSSYSPELKSMSINYVGSLGSYSDRGIDYDFGTLTDGGVGVSVSNGRTLYDDYLVRYFTVNEPTIAQGSEQDL